MPELRVLSGGLFTSVQDAGRFAYQHVGVAVSGVMDAYSYRVANMLVGNSPGECVLETTLSGPTLAFDTDACIAVTGADISPQIDGQAIETWRSYRVKAGSVLAFGGLRQGARAYIAFAGGIDVPVVMGSCSTYAKGKIGGFEGRALQAGDCLALRGCGLVQEYSLPDAYRPKWTGHNTLRVVLGPQDDCFTEEGIQTFLSQTYTVSQQCDRMGYRLEGAVIAHKTGGDIISDGIMLGSVQVPGNGLPIILMADRQTTGGYTKIATVISCDLPLIAQAIAGNSFSFQAVSIEQAQDALETQAKLLAEMPQNLVAIAPTPPPATVQRFAISLRGGQYDVTVQEI